ncbi:GAF domain-containing protein [Halobaculum marinum]|uniref:GAF domain-containing protein n=1 Tax=Halobaculum marinum TaxID=3031996 RepID=A0ABD5WQE2_9EURY|nr:GAF domain-containing protein [Halobaculum sp. DT55]
MTPGPLPPPLAETEAVFDGASTPLTTPEVAAHLDVGRRSTYNRLQDLVDRDRLRTKKVGANARIWWRSSPSTATAGADGAATTSTPDGDAPEQLADAIDADRLDPLLDILDDGVFTLDAAGRYTWVNETYTSLVGRDGEDLVGTHVSTVFDDPDVLDAIETCGRELHRGERESARRDTQVAVSGGQSRAVAVTVTAVATDDGLDRFGVVTDTTERDERERALVEANTQLQTLVDTIPNGTVTLVDDDLRYVTAFGTTSDSLDVSAADLEGKRIADVLPEEVADQLVPAYEAALAGAHYESDVTVGDRTYECHHVPVRDGDGEVYAAFGIAQDVTEREEIAGALRRQLQRQAGVTELARHALGGGRPDALFDEAVDLLASTLDVSRCGVFDATAVDGELSRRAGVGWSDADAPLPLDGGDAHRALASGETVVVSDGATSGIWAPIAPRDDSWGVVAVEGAVDGSVADRDVVFVESVATLLAVALARHYREIEAEARRDFEVAVNNLHDVVRDVTAAVIDRSTREEIEQTVCDRLADSESYEFAWIGAVDETADTVSLRAEAGVEGYLDEVTLSVDPDADPDGGPTADAVRTRTAQFTNDARTDPRHAPVRDRVRQFGFRSSAAIPITHEGTIYGVLNVYAARPNAFGERERDVIAQLGEVVGHAIAAAERKQALLSDELVELTVRIDDVFEGVATSVPPAGTFTFDYMVPLSGGDFLVYGTATPDAMSFLRDVEEHNPEWDSVTVRSHGPPVTFELRGVDLPVFSAIASRGGHLERAVVDEGDLRMTLYFAPSVDIPGAIETLRRNYPQTVLRRRRQFTRSFEDTVRVHRRMVTDLTDRQRTALEAAYHAGFFEWPRDTSGEEVAAAMDVAPPTFHQHLRKAQRKVYDAVFESPIERPE